LTKFTAQLAMRPLDSGRLIPHCPRMLALFKVGRLMLQTRDRVTHLNNKNTQYPPPQKKKTKQNKIDYTAVARSVWRLTCWVQIWACSATGWLFRDVRGRLICSVISKRRRRFSDVHTSVFV